MLEVGGKKETSVWWLGESVICGIVARSAIDDCFSLATIGRPQPQYDVLEKTQALMFLKAMLAMFNIKHKCLISASAKCVPPPVISLDLQHPPVLPPSQSLSPKARTNLFEVVSGILRERAGDE